MGSGTPRRRARRRSRIRRADPPDACPRGSPGGWVPPRGSPGGWVPPRGGPGGWVPPGETAGGSGGSSPRVNTAPRPWWTGRFPRAEEFCPSAASAAAGTVGRAAGRPRGLHHRRQCGHRRHRHYGDPERAWFLARTLRGGRHAGRRAGRPAQDRPDDLPRPGALLSGGRPGQRGRIRPFRRFVQDGAGHRRGAVDRQRLLRDGARHRAGRRDHRRPLVSLAPRQVSHARPGLAGPGGWPRPDGPHQNRPLRDWPRQDWPQPSRNGPGWRGTRWRAAAAAGSLGDPHGIRIPFGLAGSG